MVTAKPKKKRGPRGMGPRGRTAGYKHSQATKKKIAAGLRRAYRLGTR